MTSSNVNTVENRPTFRIKPRSEVLRTNSNGQHDKSIVEVKMSDGRTYGIKSYARHLADKLFPIPELSSWNSESKNHHLPILNIYEPSARSTSYDSLRNFKTYKQELIDNIIRSVNPTQKPSIIFKDNYKPGLARYFDAAPSSKPKNNSARSNSANNSCSIF